MLDFQAKLNADSQPTAFVNTEHDAQEFNSAHAELNNAVTSMGMPLTPSTVPGYENDDTTQLGRAMVLAGFQEVRGSSTGTSFFIANGNTSFPGNVVPPLSEIEFKLLQVEFSQDNTTSNFTISWNGDVKTLVNLGNNPLVVGQIRGGQKAIIQYLSGADKFFLISYVDSYLGGSFLGDVGIGGVIDDVYLDESPDNATSTRLGSSSSMNFKKDEVELFDSVNHGMKALDVAGKGKEQIANALPANTNCTAACTDLNGVSYFFALPGVGTGTFERLKIENRNVDSKSFSGFNGFISEALVDNQNNIYLFTGASIVEDIQVLRSTDGGENFSVVYTTTNKEFIGANVLLDGTICMVTCGSNGSSPLTMRYSFNGEDWFTNSNTIPGVAERSGRVKPFQTKDGKFHLMVKTFGTNLCDLYSSNTIDGVFSVTYSIPKYSGTVTDLQSTASLLDNNTGYIYVAVRQAAPSVQAKHSIWVSKDDGVSFTELLVLPDNNSSYARDITISSDGFIYVNYGRITLYRSINGVDFYEMDDPTVVGSLGAFAFSPDDRCLYYANFNTGTGAVVYRLLESDLESIGYGVGGQEVFTGKTFSKSIEEDSGVPTRPVSTLKRVFSLSRDFIQVKTDQIELRAQNGGMLVDNRGNISYLGYFPAKYDITGEHIQTFHSNGKVERLFTLNTELVITFFNAYNDQYGNSISLWGGYSRREVFNRTTGNYSTETSDASMNAGEIITWV